MSSMRRRTERSNGRERERRGPCNDSIIDGAEEEPLKQRPLKNLHGTGPHAAAVRTHLAAWEGPLGSERVGCIASHCIALHRIASHRRVATAFDALIPTLSRGAALRPLGRTA